jgi:hypothetical protein
MLEQGAMVSHRKNSRSINKRRLTIIEEPLAPRFDGGVPAQQELRISFSQQCEVVS